MNSAARALAVVACLLLAGAARADAEDQAAIGALRARHAALQNDLAHNAFGRPIHLESEQNKGDISGDIHAVLEQPFPRLNAALDAPDNWCDILILHLNIKQCRSAGGPSWSTLTVYVGTKKWQSLASAQRVTFDFNVRAHTPEYLRVELDAAEGPLGVRNFRIELEAVPLDPGRSFMHLSYSYTSGLVARLAMKSYLETLGSGKIGFSVIERASDGKPVYVGDERGVIERNTMRYYLAIDTYVETFNAAPGEQLDALRLRRWFAATEAYPRQLHEVEEAEYLDMKRRELERQRGP